MEINPEDQDIVGLLTRLKNAEEQYPEHMFVARRHMYLKRMAEIGMGIPADAGIRDTTPGPNSPPVSPITSTLLETALVFAIIVEASAVAYFYRDKLADFFQTITTQPVVQEVSPLPVVATAVEIQGVTPSAAVTPTVPSATLAPAGSPTVMTTALAGSALPGVADENNNSSQPGSSSSPGTGPVILESTPAPNSNKDGDQGNHYGQTPKPERTKESGNNNVGPGDPSPEEKGNEPAPGDNGPSPGNKDDKPPKDEPKPTKTR